MKRFRNRLILAVLLVLIVALVGIGATAMAAARGEWQPNTYYARGDTVTYQGATYECRQSHTSLVGWEPPNVPALWRLQGTATTPPPTTPPPTTPPTTPPPSGNLALNRPATSSSNENSTFPPSNAVDGNTSTRWSSAFSDPQWITVDLGATYSINRVVLNWEAAYGSAYQIQVSTNASSWTTIYSTSSGNGGTDDLSVSGSGRYVRMYGTARATQWGYSLWEFQVYGGGTPPPTTPPPTTPPPTTPPPTTPPPSGNLALNRPATSSSNENSTFPPGNAVDGSASTRWSSAFSDPQWITVDLGATYSINRVVLNWEAAYGSAYQIQVSTNASSWTTIYSTSSGNGGTDDLSVSGSGRYVRVYGTTRGTQWGYSLWEFEVYSGSAPPPTTPPPTTPPPTTPPPPPPPGNRMFAPYLDVSPGANSTLGNLAGNASSVSNMYTLAFILGRGCEASWFGTFTLDTAEANAWGTRINELRAIGGDVIIAFGGAAAPELANVCGSVSALQAQYQAVITKYNLRYMDMDIEDFSPTAIDMRNKALKNLEAANPNLRVHYTLGVLPTGMTQAQLDVLNNAKANGTRVDVVNIMAMDYYQNVQDMGGAAIQAAQATRNQLNSMGFTSTQIGITPMIGRNDSPETFTLEDAQQVVTWARSNGIVLLAFWSVGRDNGGCPNGTVSPSCSGIAQSQFEFSSIFRGFTR